MAARQLVAKAAVGACGLLVVGGLAAWTGRETVHTELVIPASPSEIWAVLSDAAGYRDWNPVLVEVTGEYRLGATLTNRVREAPGKESTMTSTVIGWQPERELRQFGGLRGFLTFEHRWTLEPVADGTRVVQHEEYRGIGVWFWDSSWVEAAYSRANEALRGHVLRDPGGRRPGGRHPDDQSLDGRRSRQ